MMAGGSIGVALIGALIYLLSGGRIDPSAIEGLTELVPAQQVEFTAEEQELASFSKKILAGTEDVWSAYFEQNGLGTYEAPSMVLYTGATSSGCGTGRSSMQGGRHIQPQLQETIRIRQATTKIQVIW